MDEATGKGEHPDDGEEDGQAGDDFGVDEAAELPAGLVAAGQGKVVACDTGGNGGKDQLFKRHQYVQFLNCREFFLKNFF